MTLLAIASRSGNVGFMRAAVAMLGAAVIASGCGGDDDETTVVETTTVTTTETVTVPSEPDPTGTTTTPPGQAPPEDGTAEAPRSCGRITFEENTDSGAFNIKAAGTDCKTARAVASAARDSASEVSYTARGFTCTGAGNNEPPLSSVEWFCLGPDREVITFSTS